MIGKQGEAGGSPCRTPKVLFPRSTTLAQLPPFPGSEPLQRWGEDRMEAVKAALLLEIRARRLSQRELARQLGHSTAYLSNLFGEIRGRGPAHLRVDTLFSLLRLLEIEPASFLEQALGGRDEEATRAPAAGPCDLILLDLRRLTLAAETAGELSDAELRLVLEQALSVVRAWALAGQAARAVPREG